MRPYPSCFVTMYMRCRLLNLLTKIKLHISVSYVYYLMVRIYSSDLSDILKHERTEGLKKEKSFQCNDTTKCVVKAD